MLIGLDLIAPNGKATFASIMKFLERSFFPLRFAAYFAAIGLFFHFLNAWTAKAGYEAVALEGGFLEGSQMLLQLLVLLGVAGLIAIDHRRRPVYLIMLVLIGAAAVREFNNEPWYQLILPGTWKLIVLLAALLGIVFTQRRTLVPAIFEKLRDPSSLLYSAGLCVTTLWAQMLAQEALVDARSDRLVEEALELAGYSLIVLGTLEDYLQWLPARSGVQKGRIRRPSRLRFRRRGARDRTEHKGHNRFVHNRHSNGEHERRE